MDACAAYTYAWADRQADMVGERAESSGPLDVACARR